MLLIDKLPRERSLFLVSGRSAFEIVQKSLLAGIPLVGADYFEIFGSANAVRVEPAGVTTHWRPSRT
jgi:hypothetical protein